MHYIGIRGHRGAGKNTVSYLLGNIINEMIKTKSFEISDELFQAWCDDIVNDEKIIHEIGLDHIYFESIGDTLKVLIHLIVGCPLDYLYSDYHKDHVVINLRDFSHKIYEEIPEEIKLTNSTELFESIPKTCPPITITKNIFITLREFILYFGKEVMQRFFGLDVWVKSLKSSKGIFPLSSYPEDNSYKIYTDLKTPSEVTYVKKMNGYIVKVSRPNHKKPKGLDKLSQDTRIDYKVIIGDNLYDIKEQLINIAVDIINKDNYGKNI